jgi:hypothetical protein
VSAAEVIELPLEVEFESVALANRQETVAAWDMADAIYRDVQKQMPGNDDASSFGTQGVSTGLGKAEEIVADAHRKAGTEITQNGVHAHFVTRRAWPPEERLPDIASYAAHYELRGKDYRNRADVLQRLARKSSTGRATRKAVQIWKSERKPPAHRTFLELAERRIRAGVKAAGHPWGHVADGDRATIARMLREIANEIEDRRFGI